MDDAIVSQLEGLMDADGYINPEPTEPEEGDDDYVEPVEGEADEVDDAEPEGDEPEEGDEGEGEGEPEGEPEGDPAADALYDITIGDEEYEVNLEELKTGYLRNEDLVQRRVALESEYSDKVTELEADREALRAELEQLTIMTMGNANRYDQVNWQQLKAQDPAKYQELRLEALEVKEQADALAKRRSDITALTKQAARLKQEARVQSQLVLARELIPEFNSDPDFGKKILAFSKTLGYTDDEVAAIDDARQLAVLNQARLYAESQVRKKAAVELKVTKDLPPALKPGAPKASNAEATKKTKLARQRLGNEKSIDAAAAFFLSSGMI